MLKKQGDWMELGSADEQKPAKDGTVEAWVRSENNPGGGWYGLKKGFHGRFGMYNPTFNGSTRICSGNTRRKGKQNESEAAQQATKVLLYVC